MHVILVHYHVFLWYQKICSLFAIKFLNQFIVGMVKILSFLNVVLLRITLLLLCHHLFVILVSVLINWIIAVILILLLLSSHSISASFRIWHLIQRTLVVILWLLI